MPNSIKYTTSTETKALRKGNFYIAVGDDPKAPTSQNGYWVGYDVPPGGYVTYLNKESNGPSIYVSNNDSDLIALINRISGQNFTTISQTLNWVSTQNDIMVVNKQYPTIVTDGLVLGLDAGYLPSYPGTSSTWYDLGTYSNNATLVNGPTFNNTNRSIVLDGIDDFVEIPYSSFWDSNVFGTATTFTIECLYKPNLFENWDSIIQKYSPVVGGWYSAPEGAAIWSDVNGFVAVFSSGVNNNPSGSIVQIFHTTSLLKWYHLCLTGDGTTLRFYVDGTLRGTNLISNRTIPVTTSSNGPTFGRRQAMNGLLGGSKFYTKSLSISEVHQNYYQAPIVTENLSALYTASNLISFEPGNTASYYMVGSSTNLNGVLQNGVLYNSGFGGYWTFDGVNDRILLNGATTNSWKLNSNLNWTVTAWIRTTTTVVNSLGQGPIFSNSSGGPVYSVMCINNGRATYWHYNGTWLRKSGSIKVNDGKWHMITWVNRSNATMDIYVDNNLDLSNASSALSSTNHLDIIGGSWAGSFQGDISSLQINNGVSFSKEQVDQNYKASLIKFPYAPTLVTNGLVIHLDALNPNSYSSGNTWFDLSGNGNNAVRNGQTGNPTWNASTGWFFPATTTGINGGFTISNSASIQNLSTITVFLVVAMQTKTLISGDTNWMAIYSKHGSDQRIAISVNQSNSGSFRYLHIETPSQTNSTVNLFTDADYTGTKYNIISARVSDSGTTGWLNGVQVSQSTNTTTGNTGPLYLGLDIDNEMFRGYMKNVLTYNRSLSDGEMRRVFEYLNTTYSVY